METLAKIKEKLKDQARIIKSRDTNNLHFEKVYTRHLHMIYGLLRNVPLEKIERKCYSPLQKYMLNQICKGLDVEVDCEQLICHSRSVLV